MSKIKEFWIINWKGGVLFKYPQPKNLEFMMYSNFFAAIQMFAKELVDDEDSQFVHRFSVGDSNYYFLENFGYELYFVINMDKKISTKLKEINKFLQRIESSFIVKFKSFLDLIVMVNKEVHPSIFEPYQDEFEQLLKKHM
jgi:hypothetical protein